MLGQTLADGFPSVFILVDPTQLPVELHDGVLKIMKHTPRNNIVTSDTYPECDYQWPTRFVYDHELKPGECIVSRQDTVYERVHACKTVEITIQYHRRIEAFRALGRVLSATRDPRLVEEKDSSLLNFREQAQFDTQGVMIDCSRNGVLRPQSVYFVLCKMALLGLNTLQLYTEDTYEVDGEPIFGYLRGKCSLDVPFFLFLLGSYSIHVDGLYIFLHSSSLPSEMTP
ncbi:hypothetical protein BDF14DRAFT_130083 [Spinellus fusiger]|nr:hypothetical protein BDF14DRAFT_130083 [Spinellus fusiger]